MLFSEAKAGKHFLFKLPCKTKLAEEGTKEQEQHLVGREYNKQVKRNFEPQAGVGRNTYPFKNEFSYIQGGTSCNGENE